MEALCPDCDNELTPSIVGYLCHNCGSVHQFDKISKQPIPRKTKTDDAIETSSKTNQKSSHKRSMMIDDKSNKSPSKLKSLFVPRISTKNATSINSKR